MKLDLEELIETIDSSGESAALAVADHLRTVASNGADYATQEALRAEAENLVEWAVEFLRETGGVPPSLIDSVRQSRAQRR